MPLETATFISDLVTSNPAHSDGLNQADAHIRLIKSVLKTTLAGIGQLVAPSGDLLVQSDGTATAPAISFASEPTLGFFRSAAGVISVVGGKLKGGVPTGATFMFLAEPASLGKGGTGTGFDYLELDGSTWNTADFPDLAAQLGITATTFTLPKMNDTGSFPRSRTATVTAGTKQANTVGPHTHPDQAVVTGTENQAHVHNVAGSTGADSPDHSHGLALPVGGTAFGVTGGGNFSLPVAAGNFNTGGASARHAHAFNVNSGTESANHNHNLTVPTPANTGTTETRPEALSFVFCIKT